MNVDGSQNAGGDSQPAPAPGSQGNSSNPLARLIRPEQIQVLRLDDATKQKYTEALKKMWGVLESSDPQSQQYKTAFTQLQSVSTRLRQQYASQQPGQRPMSQQGQPSQAPSQNPQQTQNTQQPAQAQQAAARPPVQQARQAPPPAIMNRVNSISWIAPGMQAGTPEAEQKINQLKQQFIQALTIEGQMKDNMQKLKAAVENLNRQQKPIPQDLHKREGEIRTRFMEAANMIKKISEEQENARKAQQGGQQQPQPTQGGGVSAPTPQSFNLQMPQSRQDSPPQSATLPPSNSNIPQQMHPSQSPVTAQNPQASTPQQPQSATFPPQQQGQLPGPTQGQGGQNLAGGQRPPFNLQQPSQIQSGQQQSPQTAGPQGNGANGTNGPQTLSHAAAIAQSQAARANFPNQQNQPAVAPAGQANAQPQSAYPGQTHRPGEQTNTQPKMPIPKQLQVTSPVPVSMGPARPTMGGPGSGPGAPGVMGQPVIPKMTQPPQPAGFTLEGDDGKVLSKKKLDELVRQVTGAEGGGQQLTPEVEEAMLSIADDFVDDVITAACRLAKMRESATLDIRDIQIILERNYNIRIPGYATDEVRTVRKFHPAPGWTAKMNAVQAAKVMGGKTDI